VSADSRIDIYERGQVEPVSEDVRTVYGEVYAEPPYNEGNEDVERFMRRLVIHQQQPRFKLVLARRDSEAVGFAYGYGLRSTTTWWSDMITDLPAEATSETDGRTFAVLELAVREPWRRRHIGRDLHDALLASRPEERAVLMVDRSAQPAKAAYARWGWHIVGRAQPWPGAPPYDAMLLALRPIRPSP
jgi:ribosomal protein S18 acetylase RimI-like enzyme